MAGAPVMMIALVALRMQNQSEALPPVQPGAAFWSDPDYVAGLISSGMARLGLPGDPAPRQPSFTVRGVAGFGRGAANSSP